MDVRSCVLMRRGHMAFSRDCTEDSHIPLSCEMKDEPGFNHCKEIRFSFESGHLGFHST